MNGFTTLLLILGAADLAALAIFGPWYLVYKFREWGREK